MTDQFFRRAVFFSFLGHFMILAVFSLSFGPKPLKINYAPIAFWGSFLPRLSMPARPAGTARQAVRVENALPAKTSREIGSLRTCYLKPAVYLSSGIQKGTGAPVSELALPVRPKRQSVVMFYPPIPRSFLLYFKYRPTVKIELAFNILSGPGKESSLLVKRKISSGNLEVDLLSMRYLGRYLYMQQMGFVPNAWHPVKIELSPKND